MVSVRDSDMSNLAIFHQFITELARSKRVLLVGNDFELLQRLAMTELSELIVCDSSADPNAPDGLTPTRVTSSSVSCGYKGASRFSKDPVIDLSGLLNKAEVERLLKKSGQYICTKKKNGALLASTPKHRSPSTAGFSAESQLLLLPSTCLLPEEPPSINPDETWWLFTREGCVLPNLVIAHDWGRQTNPEQAEQAERLRQDLKDASEETHRLKNQISDVNVNNERPNANSNEAGFNMLI